MPELSRWLPNVIAGSCSYDVLLAAIPLSPLSVNPTLISLPSTFFFPSHLARSLHSSVYTPIFVALITRRGGNVPHDPRLSGEIFNPHFSNSA